MKDLNETTGSIWMKDGKEIPKEDIERCWEMWRERMIKHTLKIVNGGK